LILRNISKLLSWALDRVSPGNQPVTALVHQATRWAAHL
jgi:hypothetical protein